MESQADEISRVTERIFTEGMVYRAAARRFEMHRPNPAERALIPMLEMLSALPLKESEAIDRLVRAGHREEDVRKALDLQRAFQLIRAKDLPDFGGPLLYNEYL